MNVLHSLPPNCRSGESIWMTDTFMLQWENVEFHPIRRVMRQFGMFQAIPPTIPLTRDEFNYLKNLNRNGKSDNWLNRHSRYVNSWRYRHQNIVVGEFIQGSAISDDYMDWYMSRTVLHITNPTSAQTQQSSYNNDGGGMQYMVILFNMNKYFIL